MSGTPCAESASQWFHQLHINRNSPFANYSNFYQWARTYVIVKDRHLGYAVVKDYSGAKVEAIELVINPIIHKFTQQQAGFVVKNEENIIEVMMQPITYHLINKLKSDKFYQGKTGSIIADSEVKLMSKLHQLASGTCKLEEGQSVIVDKTKINTIIDTFKDKKIAIFYYYIEERKMIMEALSDKATNDINEFNSTDKWLVLQQYSGAMGINLSKADALVFLNVGFSGTNYIQALDRMTTIDRQKNKVYFIHAINTLDAKIHKTITNKKNFTLKCFRQNS